MADALRIVVTAVARQDLRSIWQFIAQDNPKAATATVIRITQSFEVLTLFPSIGRRVWRRARYRSRAVSNYIVYYEPMAREGCVRIIRIVHGARRRPKLR